MKRTNWELRRGKRKWRNLPASDEGRQLRKPIYKMCEGLQKRTRGQPPLKTGEVTKAWQYTTDGTPMSIES
jgi:hypothetical protein